MLTNTFYKLMCHNMIGYEMNSNFVKSNHVVPHQFVKCVYKSSIFLWYFSS
jgi:hypothetical protein